MSLFKELNKKQRKSILQILFSAAAVALSFAFRGRPAVRAGILLAAYGIVSYDILRKAFRGIRRKQPFDENFLMAVASLGALAMGEMTEAAEVMIFYRIGELFESIAVGRSRRNISALMDIRPDSANLVRESGDIETVYPDEVEVGAEIIVRPGEKVPIDGIVVEGSGGIDTSALTGESRITGVSPGDEILSGSINVNSVLRIRTTREFGESTASKILDLVENASSRKSKSEDFISKFARVYTPAVCLSALALAIVPPVVQALLHHSPQWSMWIYRALTFLVISCPCALVISVPLAFFAGLGGAGNAGVLIKGSNYMEPLSKARTVVFDKTGTMTKGVFEVSGVFENTMPKDQLLEYAALAEAYSGHPISLSLQRAYHREPDRARVSHAEEISGEGVIACVDGHSVACGNRKLMQRENIPCPDAAEYGTVVHIAVDEEYAGSILISDVLKQNAKKAVAEMKKLGVKKTVMLTGDSSSAAQKIADELSVDECCSELLPGDKVEIVEKLLAQKEKNEYLIFAGDGLNDAPVLARSDIGISMGGIGSDAAIEASDVVIMDDDPLKIVKAIRIARKCMKIVYENITFAIGVKVLCLVLTALGISGMWLAIFADTGVMVLAVLNSVRALKVRNL